MACSERVSQWRQTVSSHLPHLSGPQAAVLALWSLGIVLSGSCGLSQVSALLAMVLGQSEETVRQRLREWYYPAQDKAGKKRCNHRCYGEHLIDAHGERAVASLGSVDMTLGGIRIERHPVLVLPPSSSAKGIPLAGFDGLLGWNAIRELRITIDNLQQTITFERPLSVSARQESFFWLGRPWARAPTMS